MEMCDVATVAMSGPERPLPTHFRRLTVTPGLVALQVVIWPGAEGRVQVAQQGEADAAAARRFGNNRPTPVVRRLSPNASKLTLVWSVCIVGGWDSADCQP